MKLLSTTVIAVMALTTLLSLPAQGKDFYIKQKVTTDATMGQPARASDYEVWVSNDKIRSINTSENQEFIFDLKKRKVYLIKPLNQSYVEFDLDQFQNFARMGMGIMQTKSDTPPETKIVRTGKQSKIGKWNCEEIEVTHTGPININFHMWVTKDIKIDMKDYSHASESMGFNNMLGNVFEKMAEIDGFPVKIIASMDMFNTPIVTSTEVSKVIIKPIPASVFALPKNFKKQTFNFNPQSSR